MLAPNSLLLYETLQARKQLTPLEKQRYEQVRKGFSGEKKLRNYINCSNLNNIIPIYDCLFSVDESEFQIDCLLLTSDAIYLLEVKNYTGDYYMEDDLIHYLKTKTQISNPMMQIDRSEFLFKKLLREMDIEVALRSYIIFINENFMLYGANALHPMIFSSQISRFLNKINNNTRPLSEEINQVAIKLSARRLQQSTRARLPTYALSQMKKGVFCDHCLAPMYRYNKATAICKSCQQVFPLEDIALLAIAQYKLLFLHEKLTVNAIENWCGSFFSKGFIRKIFTKNFAVTAKRKATHYDFKDDQEHLKILTEKYDYKY